MVSLGSLYLLFAVLRRRGLLRRKQQGKRKTETVLRLQGKNKCWGRLRGLHEKAKEQVKNIQTEELVEVSLITVCLFVCLSSTSHLTCFSSISRTLDFGVSGSSLDLGIFYQVTGSYDEHDFTLRSSWTPSASTGPSADHTPGDVNGNYIYLEASGSWRGIEGSRVSICRNRGPDQHFELALGPRY